MLKIFAVLLTIASVITTPFAISAAEEAYTPLMIIRFNKNPTMPYENQLYNAVSAALRVKPGATFDVESRSSIKGVHKGGEVADALSRIGVPGNRIAVQNVQGDMVYPEVRIFVK